VKVLYFTCRGEQYKVKENGDMLQVKNTYNDWDGGWQFWGVSFHHWRKSPDLFVDDAFNNYKNIIGGLVWDIDHGTVRRWGGSYCGSLPRITNAYVEILK